jgi:hypothetical protein
VQYSAFTARLTHRTLPSHRHHLTTRLPACASFCRLRVRHHYQQRLRYLLLLQQTRHRNRAHSYCHHLKLSRLIQVHSRPRYRNAYVWFARSGSIRFLPQNLRCPFQHHLLHLHQCTSMARHALSVF